MKKIKKRYDKNGRLTEEIVYDENGEIVESTSYEYEEPPSYLSFPSLKDTPQEEPKEFNLNEPDLNNTNSIDEDEQTNYQLDKWSDVSKECGVGTLIFLLASIIFLIISVVITTSLE